MLEIKSLLAPAIVTIVAASAFLQAADISVFAAVSLKQSLAEIGDAYEGQSGDKLIYNFGASSTLARQIEQGAPADIFFSADEAKMDTLEKKGLLLPGSRRSVISNTLVIVAPTDAHTPPKSALDLARPEIKRLALAEPRSVPAGVYAREYLDKLGIWSAVKEKVVPMENVRSALAAVESGNVDAGIIYKTDALISKNVQVVVEIPRAEGPQISYPVAVIKGSRHAERAEKFVAHLAGVAANAIFQKFGFLPAN